MCGCVWGGVGVGWEEGGNERALKIEHRFLLKNSAAASRCRCGANRFFFLDVVTVGALKERERLSILLLLLLPPFLPSFNTSAPPPLLGGRGAASEAERRIWTGAKWSAMTGMAYGTG